MHNLSCRVIDISSQTRELYPQVFVSPSNKISTIVENKYKQAGMIRTPASTLTTIWVGINDIDLTFGWQDTNELDFLIMQHYQVLIVKYALLKKWG